MTSIITNINCLVNTRTENKLLRGKELAELPVIKDAYLVIEDGLIADFGAMENLIHHARSFSESYDATNHFVMPCWCDSHTHLVFTGSREVEFVDKINGFSYQEIAEKGGGILNSSKLINAISENSLYEEASKRLKEVSKLGTGSIEIKSGYGLTVEGELKMLRVIKRLKETSDLTIRSTFLGAHTFPEEYKNNHQQYIEQIIYQMLPAIAAENLADYIDVFSENGFFNLEETEMILKAGIDYGLKAKIHANQLSNSGATELGVKMNAISVDHLEMMDDRSIEILANSTTIGTLLPTAAFFLRMPLQPARQLIDAGSAIALASDYNPGSSPSGNMNFVIALSCIQMKMLPEEAINAATINGAFAMGVENEVGSITVGKKANFIFSKPMPSLAYLPYSFGSNLIDKVMIKGKFL
jgi:imidazolonepropionase